MDASVTTNATDQRLAVARLTTYCEIIITRGLLPMDKEITLRALVNSTCNAFEMANVGERDAIKRSAVSAGEKFPQRGSPVNARADSNGC